MSENIPQMHGTTILAVHRPHGLAMGGDGQVSLGNTVLKHHAKKVRRLFNDKVLAGFAGATADAFTLFEMFETELEEHGGNLMRAAVELGKKWRTDKYLRRLEAFMIVANREHLFVLSGNGDIIEPDDGVAAIGSGGPYALAAAKGLLKHSDLPVEKIVRSALEIAASICVFTNDHIETLVVDS